MHGTYICMYMRAQDFVRTHWHSQACLLCSHFQKSNLSNMSWAFRCSPIFTISCHFYVFCSLISDYSFMYKCPNVHNSYALIKAAIYQIQAKLVGSNFNTIQNYTNFIIISYHVHVLAVKNFIYQVPMSVSFDCSSNLAARNLCPT